MTAQIHDALWFSGTEYAILARESAWPFDPSDYCQCRPSTSTACWRGYVATLSVRDDQLRLDSVLDPFHESKLPSFIERLRRFACLRRPAQEAEQRGLDVALKYDGGLVIGAGFLPEHYVHMGFQRPCCFSTVKELRFVGGLLVDHSDHSSAMQLRRNRLKTSKQLLSESVLDDADFQESVRRAFSLAYPDKWRI